MSDCCPNCGFTLPAPDPADVYAVEVPGQHTGTGFRCRGCGGDYGSFTLACKTCANRHGWRRRQGTRIRAAQAPTRRVWFS